MSEPDTVSVCLPGMRSQRVGLDDGVGRLALDLGRQRHAVGLEEDGALGDAEPDHHGRGDECHDGEGEAHERNLRCRIGAASNKDIPHYRRCLGVS